MVSLILGGVGLFLIGMVLITEGLKAAAGDALRRGLSRLTGGRLRAVFSGAAITMAVQSSSATTLATIGFVSAGLLTFPQAIGLIFGANVGTTSTGWIVALLGLKLGMGAIALPLIGLGALFRLLGRGRIASIGLATAGFGLIFVGIDTLQAGMSTLSDRFDPAVLPGATLAGRILLVGMGMVMTFVTQSSSASVAATITALHAGTLELDQAALLVIGQNVGTTLTAAIAAIGASVAAKRTALAHILFNVFTAVVAFLILPWLLELLGAINQRLGADGDAAVIAAFHTAFSVLGVMMLLPVSGAFARLISHLVPERGAQLTRNLDATVANVSAVAVEAARRTVREVAGVLIDAVRRELSGTDDPLRTSRALEAASTALRETQQFLAEVRTTPEAAEYERHLSVLHAIDHLDNLIEAMQEPQHRPALRDDPGLRAIAVRLAECLEPVEEWHASDMAGDAAPAEAESVSRTMAELRRTERIRILEQTAHGAIEPGEALIWMDAIRWLDRLAYHIWRTTHHLAEPVPGAAASVPDAVPEPMDVVHR